MISARRRCQSAGFNNAIVAAVASPGEWGGFYNVIVAAAARPGK